MDLEERLLCEDGRYRTLTHFVHEVKDDLGLGDQKAYISSRFKKAYLCSEGVGGGFQILPRNAWCGGKYLDVNDPSAFSYGCSVYSIRDLRDMERAELAPLVDVMVEFQRQAFEESTGITVSRSYFLPVI